MRLRELLPLLTAACAAAAMAQEANAPESHAVADAVVIVDTSASMREAGMDPERSSLLVTRLLADIVPGDLAVVRLLDARSDENVLPHRLTGRTMPCSENPALSCQEVERASDWEADARSRRLGALVRPSRGDAGYKQALVDHLDQRINNSMFSLAFRAAQGVFEGHRKDPSRPADVPQTVVWLSDGRSEDPELVRQAIGELTAGGAGVEAIVFGRGDIRLAQDAGLTPRRVDSPAAIMKAFAAAFRRIVQAPYEIDNLVSVQPGFEMKRNVDEAWIVVYGDDSLGEVTIDGPGQTVRADYAVDRWPGAGAYKVAYLERPAAGPRTVHASAGGPGVAYAVVQRSSLVPVLVEPKRAFSGQPVRLIAGVRAGRTGELITDPELLRELTLTAELQGQTITLADGGAKPDAAAGDGRFSGTATFRGSGRVPIRLRVRSPLGDRTAGALIDVAGFFRATGGPVEVDLGTLGVNAQSCRPLLFRAERQGVVPLELRQLRRPPSGHRLEVRLPAGKLSPGSKPLPAGSDDRFEVCLATTKLVPSSTAAGEPWLELRAAGSEAAEQKITIRLRWHVQGLSFWQRWGWLILLILGILVLLFLIGGYVMPHRFQSGLAVVFAPERDELEEQTPQPVRQWRGVGVGFYRNARAFLHADFRLSGRTQGALASLHAEKSGTQVVPGRGTSLSRETLDSGWESVPLQGRRGRGGDVYRIGERGPYFRIATRGRT